jgi:hypothetical protein
MALAEVPSASSGQWLTGIEPFVQSLVIKDRGDAVQAFKPFYGKKGSAAWVDLWNQTEGTVRNRPLDPRKDEPRRLILDDNTTVIGRKYLHWEIGPIFRQLQLWHDLGIGARIVGVGLKQSGRWYTKEESRQNEVVVLQEDLRTPRNEFGKLLAGGPVEETIRELREWPTDVKEEIQSTILELLDFFHGDPHLKNVYLELRDATGQESVPDGINIFKINYLGRDMVARFTLIDPHHDGRPPLLNRTRVAELYNSLSQRQYLRQQLGLTP